MFTKEGVKGIIGYSYLGAVCMSSVVHLKQKSIIFSPHDLD